MAKCKEEALTSAKTALADIGQAVDLAEPASERRKVKRTEPFVPVNVVEKPREKEDRDDQSHIGANAYMSHILIVLTRSGLIVLSHGMPLWGSWCV